MVSSVNPRSKAATMELKPQYLELLMGLTILPLLMGLLAQHQLLKGSLILGNWCENLFLGIALPFVETMD